MSHHKRRPLEIAFGQKMWCPNHTAVYTVIDVLPDEDGFDIAVLSCQCARTRHLEPTENAVSLETIGSPEGAKFFPADRSQAFPFTGSPAAATVAVPVRRK